MASRLPVRPCTAPTGRHALCGSRQTAGHAVVQHARRCVASRAGAAAIATGSGSGSGLGGGGRGGSGGSGGGGPGDAADGGNGSSGALMLGTALAVAVLDWADSWPGAAGHRPQGARRAAGTRGRGDAAVLAAGLAALSCGLAALHTAASTPTNRPGGSEGGSGGSGGGGSTPPPPAAGPPTGTAAVAASAAAAAAAPAQQPAFETAQHEQAQPAQEQQPAACSAGVAPASPRPSKGCSAAAIEEASSAPAAAQPKRIALFIEPSPFTYTSGYQTRFRATIREMVAQGCEVLVVTPGRGAAGLLPGGEAQPAEYEGARIVEAGSFPCPGYASVPLSLGLSPRIFNEVRAWQPDIIHVTSPGALPAAAWLYSRLLRVPLVASYHTHVPAYLPRLGLGWLNDSMWAAIRAIHRAAHLTIAVSPATAADLVGAGACDRQAVKVWPKAVDCLAFSPAHACPDMRQRLAGSSAGSAAPSAHTADPQEGPLLLYVGRVSPEKNLALLRPLLEQVPGARLAVVGDGPAMAEVQAHFAGSPATFLGKLTGRQLAAAYASADIFVMPSESETLGNVVGEAMASGLPVVAAAAGGVPSVIGRPGTTGLLFPPGDVDAAAAAVRQLASDSAARRRMGAAARAEMERWSWRAATRELLRRHYPAALAAWRHKEKGSSGVGATPLGDCAAV